MDLKTAILEKITHAGFPEKEVAISVEDFFDGNDDDGSIGANLYPDQPSLQFFRDTFDTMLSSGKVENIYIRIADAEDSVWFYTDTAYIVGDATLEEVTEMLKELMPTEIYQEWMYGQPVNVAGINPGKNVYSVWWD